MGLMRVFSRSIRFTFRSKRRFLVFMVIFAIISTLIALNINSLDTLTTDDLLEQKGVTIQKIENIDIAYPEARALYDEILQLDADTTDFNIEASTIFRYADVDDGFRIHSLDITNPWISDFLNPAFIVEGRYPSGTNEIIIPDGTSRTQQLNLPGTFTIDSELAIGQTLVLGNGQEEIELHVVGKFDDTEYDITNQDNDLWMFMDDALFDDLLSHYDIVENDVLVYGESFVVEGLILRPETYAAANALKDEVEALLVGTETIYGDWQDVPDGILPTQDTQDSARLTLLTIGFVVIGGVILSTMFAYLISRFRRREIAILKAMGYSHGSVRTSLFGEILTTSFTGFVVGLGGANAFLLYPDFDFGTLIRLQAIGVSFVIMVIVSLPGMFFASRRILGVSPAEAFRSNN